MKQLKIAANATVAGRLHTQREIVSLSQTDFTDVAAVVVSLEEARCGVLALLQHTGFGIPAFVVNEPWYSADDVLPSGRSWLRVDGAGEHAPLLEKTAADYQAGLLPPFFDTLSKYVGMRNSTFACPGHQGGQFFRKHPTGRQFFEFYGETLFRSDIANRLKNDYILCPDMRQRSIAGCYQNNVAWLYLQCGCETGRFADS